MAVGPGRGVFVPVAVMLVVSPPFPRPPSALIRLRDQSEVLLFIRNTLLNDKRRYRHFGSSLLRCGRPCLT